MNETMNIEIGGFEFASAPETDGCSKCAFSSLGDQCDIAIGKVNCYEKNIIWIYSKSKNAKLIESAPDLLESLVAMVSMYEELQPSGGYQGVYELAVAAIAKATNE